MSYIVQQVRSTEEGKRPRPEQLAEGQLAVNVNNASPGVFLRTTEDKVIKVGGVAVGPTTPFAVYNNEYSIGELWYDTTADDLKVFDGENFVSSSSSTKALADFKAGAPNALQTLQAVAAALGNDPTRSATVDTRIQAAEDAAAALSALVNSNELSRTIGQSSLQTALDDEAILRSQGDDGLSDRLDVLEANPVSGTQLATTLSDANAYTDTAIAGLVGTAGESLNTLGEIANAIGGDANFATTTQDSLKLKANLYSPQLTGAPTAPTFTAGTNNNSIATTAFVQTAVNNLIGAAPGTLDTLNEIAAAINDDANFAVTTTAAISALQTDVDQNESDADAAILELDGNVNDLITLSGVAENATNLGTFSGTTIADSSSVKVSLQALENAVEAKLNSSAVSAFGLTLVDDADAGTARTTLGLGNVDNTSDVNKPVSTATQSALDLKADITTVTEIDENVDDLITLSGVAENSTHLGAFSGSTIADDQTVKAAIQALETAVEGHIPVLVEVHNQSGADLTKGVPVHVSGTHASGKPTVELADSDGSGTYPAIGLVHATITDGGDGLVNISGFLDGIDTDTPAWDAGTALYLDSTAGELTSTRPTGSAEKVQKVAIVARRHQSFGSVIVMGAGRTNDVPNELTALTGVALNATNLGTFSGSTIADSETIKGALQDVETAVETKLTSDAATVRTLLGIGEYADDAAAGTGGVASGAMYYNTTSSDYRLKS